jgi:hypothetical protein
METIRIVKKPGSIRIFGFGGIHLCQESWMNQREKHNIIEIKLKNQKRYNTTSD